MIKNIPETGERTMMAESREITKSARRLWLMPGEKHAAEVSTMSILGYPLLTLQMIMRMNCTPSKQMALWMMMKMIVGTQRMIFRTT